MFSKNFAEHLKLKLKIYCTERSNLHMQYYLISILLWKFSGAEWTRTETQKQIRFF
jgi:hypothetical protein